MQQGAQTIFTMPKSKISTLSQLKGKLVGVNAPGNIDYLLDVSVLKENGIDPNDVRFPAATDKSFAATEGAIPFPDMAGTWRPARSPPPPCRSRSPARPSSSTARCRWRT